MDHTVIAARVRTILEHAGDHPWRLQETGLLGLRLDDRRELRLHMWDPDAVIGDPPIHDHPYDFTSIVLAGALTNTRYVEDAAGATFRRERYAIADERARRTDTVALVGTPTTFGPGEQYHQLAAELHDSRQVPGTVTVIRCRWRDSSELTVCLRPDAAWVSGRSRTPTAQDIERITGAALERMAAVPVG